MREYRRRARALASMVALASAAVLAACSGSTSATSATTSSTATTAGPAAGRPDAAGTVWLCRPGQSDDPCVTGLDATVVHPDGSTSVQRAVPAADPPIDCFYVYPTVSREPMANADLQVQPAETDVAKAQAARFSAKCRVYAPMYRQLTVSAISAKIDARAAATAYLGVQSAWRDYLAHYNQGRGVVLIGHSQGSSMLIPLIRREIDPSPSERRLLVSALLLGGNVTVPVGKTVGGDFDHVPACTSASQTGCVVAYSTFDTTPPADSLFGRVGSSLGAQSGLGTGPDLSLQVLCTNPAALGGGTGPLVPYVPAPAATPDRPPWVTYPDLYTGTCESSGGATWLQVTATPGPGDTRPVVKPTLGPRWGLHVVDVNIALGNLVALVGSQAAAYAA